MSELSYNKYYFIGNALTEEQFGELKKLYQENPHLVQEKYRVESLKEIFHEFKFQLLLLLIAGIVTALFQLFLPNPTGFLYIVLWVACLVVIFGTISTFISWLYFLSYLGKKRHYGTLHLYLLQICPDFKSYMEAYLKYSS
jgi:hypothetical protein